MKKILLTAVGAMLVLTACGPHDGEHCATRHNETYTSMECFMRDSKTQTCKVYMPVQHTRSVCDQWVPDNAATVKPEN